MQDSFGKVQSLAYDGQQDTQEGIMGASVIKIGNIKMSPTIGALAAALAKAQGGITGAVKGSENPYFKSNYADLASVLDACRHELSANGLSVIQIPGRLESAVVLDTVLAHASGEWISGTFGAVPAKQDAQSIGSVTTYLRRYSLAAMVGIAQVDDDGNAATGKTTTPTIGDKPIDEKKVGEAYTKAMEICDSDDMDNGPEEARKLYATLTNDERVRLGELLKDQKAGKKSYASIFREYLTYKPVEAA